MQQRSTSCSCPHLQATEGAPGPKKSSPPQTHQAEPRACRSVLPPHLLPFSHHPKHHNTTPFIRAEPRGTAGPGTGGPQASQTHQDPTEQQEKYPCQAHGLSFCHTECRFTWHRCPHGMRATTCPRVPQTHQAASGPQLHMAVWPQPIVSSTGAASLCPAPSPRGASQHSAHRRDSSPAIPHGTWVF